MSKSKACDCDWLYWREKEIPVETIGRFCGRLVSEPCHQRTSANVLSEKWGTTKHRGNGRLVGQQLVRHQNTGIRKKNNHRNQHNKNSRILAGRRMGERYILSCNSTSQRNFPIWNECSFQCQQKIEIKLKLKGKTWKTSTLSISLIFLEFSNLSVVVFLMNLRNVYIYSNMSKWMPTSPKKTKKIK